MNAISTRSKLDTNVMPLVVWRLSDIAHTTRKELSTPHRLADFVLLWIISGVGTLSTNKVNIALNSGTVYCINPGQLHALEMEADLQGYMLRFTREFISHPDFISSSIYEYGFLHSSSSLTIIAIPLDIQPFLQTVTERMLKEIENVYALRREAVVSLLKLFLLNVSRQVDDRGVMEQHNEHYVDLVNRFMLLLEKHGSNRKPVHFYADELHVRPNYLNTIVKRVTRFQASYHIQQRVIIEAKRQAAFGLTTMKEIAMNLGFKDSSHFSHFFIKNAGIKFSNYQRKIRGQYFNPVDSTDPKLFSILRHNEELKLQ